MEVVKVVTVVFQFICTVQFWRMAVLWTLSLIFSFLDLFSHKISKSKSYSRSSPQDTKSNAATPRRLPICIITGATSGLGAAAAHALAKEGFYVVLVGRSSELLSKVLLLVFRSAMHVPLSTMNDFFNSFMFQVMSDIKSKNNDACLKAFQLDLSSLKSIIKFKSSIQHWLMDSSIHPSIQLLINNAGILATSCRITSEGYDQMMAINYVGAFCLTKVLLPLLENSPVPSRVVNVSSFTHRNVWKMQADRETVSGTCFMKSRCYPYAQIYEYSKLCLLLFSYELHRQFGRAEKSHHLSVVAVDPGAVKTNIMREIPSCISQMAYTALNLLGLLQSSETGARSIVDGALAPPEISGVYLFGGNGCCLKSSALSRNVKLAENLWATSCDLFEELQLAS